MAFIDLGSFGANGSTVANQATLALTAAQAANVGDLIVLVIADDNSGSGDHEGIEISSITDNSSGGPNTWTLGRAWVNGQGSAQAGASCALYYSILTHAIAQNDTITVTFAFSASSDATGITSRRFSANGSIVVEGTNKLATDAADPGALDLTTANRSCLRVRGIGGEVGNDTSLTPTANWTAWANGNSAVTGTTAEMCARAEHHVSTGTTDSSDPTWVSCYNASVYVAFTEQFTGTGALSAQASAMAGSGFVGTITGTGALVDQAAIIVGLGVSASLGIGALVSQVATITGSGVVGTPEITGTGALAAQSSDVTGVGVSASLGTGALAAQSSDVTGVGVVGEFGITGIGALTAQPADMTGVGVSASLGTGALAAILSAIQSYGITISIGTGALVASDSAVSGSEITGRARYGSTLVGSYSGAVIVK